MKTETDKDAAYDAARNAIHHIDEMYPAMWSNVPKTARTSVMNFFYFEVMKALESTRSAQPGSGGEMKL